MNFKYHKVSIPAVYVLYVCQTTARRVLIIQILALRQSLRLAMDENVDQKKFLRL